MREIKFRAWDKRTKYMAEVVGFKYTPDGKIEIWYKHNDTDIDYAICEKEHIVLMQFTGLHDKNGVEIYEGDIVTGKLGKIAEVKWLQEHCAYVGYCREDNKYYYLECGNERFENVVIIGNIYDNPELLESGE